MLRRHFLSHDLFANQVPSAFMKICFNKRAKNPIVRKDEKRRINLFQNRQGFEKNKGKKPKIEWQIAKILNRFFARRKMSFFFFMLRIGRGLCNVDV